MARFARLMTLAKKAVPCGCPSTNPSWRWWFWHFRMRISLKEKKIVTVIKRRPSSTNFLNGAPPHTKRSGLADGRSHSAHTLTFHTTKKHVRHLCLLRRRARRRCPPRGRQEVQPSCGPRRAQGARRQGSLLRPGQLLLPFPRRRGRPLPRHPLRYAGYSNEVGEAFEAFLPEWGVAASYGLASACPFPPVPRSPKTSSNSDSEPIIG